jgi:Putative Actinobacterial Holin-X, holin superfamily III
VPLLVRPHEYAWTAETIRRTLEAGGIRLTREEAPWLLTAPQKVLRALGGRVLADQLPKEFYFFRNEALDVAVTPNAVTLQGEKASTARAHAWVCEKTALGPGLQTVDAEAQRLEKTLKDIWAVYARDPEAHSGSAALLDGIDALSKKLEETVIGFEDWQVLYREMLQVSRAIEGKAQLLDTEAEETMEKTVGKVGKVGKPESGKPEKSPSPQAARIPAGSPEWPPRPGRGVASLSTPRLVSGLTSELKGLIEKEIALAKAEIRVDLQSDLKSAKWLGISAVLALCFLNMLFVALALALSKWMALPIAALAVAGALLLVTIGAALRAKAAFVKPLETTRKTIDEGWTWAKNRIA